MGIDLAQLEDVDGGAVRATCEELGVRAEYDLIDKSGLGASP